ncbi:hypothetical protein [Azospirillum sp. sgz301742]
MSSNRLSVIPATDDSVLPVPETSLNREPDVQLAAMVPQSVKRAVRRRAEEEGTTVRSVLLRALKLAGIAEVDDTEIADRRVAAGAMRSGLWRTARR